MQTLKPNSTTIWDTLESSLPIEPASAQDVGTFAAGVPLMEKALEYRALAEQLRHESALAALEHVRRMKLGAAARWDELASEIEMVVAPGRENASAMWIW